MCRTNVEKSVWNEFVRGVKSLLKTKVVPQLSNWCFTFLERNLEAIWALSYLYSSTVWANFQKSKWLEWGGTIKLPSEHSHYERVIPGLLELQILLLITAALIKVVLLSRKLRENGEKKVLFQFFLCDGSLKTSKLIPQTPHLHITKAGVATGKLTSNFKSTR